MSTHTSARPTNWKALAPGALAGTVTFGSQSTLPKLPVPELEATLTRLKETLKPLARTEEEFAVAQRKIDEFAVGKGPELHARLLKHNETTQHWLEQWWDDAGYLGYRDSVVVNVSYYYGFDEHPAHLRQSPAARAAGLARAVMSFRQKLKQGLVKPDATKEGPLCMDSYRWMFDSCRVPGPQGLDWSVSYAKEGDTGDSGHIVVFRKNRVWKLDAAKDGRILSTDEFERQIQYIYDASGTKEFPGVGVLSASNRDVWATDYAELLSNPQNESIIRTIQSAAFSISLDDSTPDDPISFSRDLWHGHIASGSDIPTGLRNRWVDKPLQFIVYDNAKAGFMGEHSIMDGTPSARLCDEVLDLLHDRTFDHGAAPPSAAAPTPTPLDWVVTPTITRAIAQADKAAASLIESQALGFHRTSYGKSAIKQFRVSPDSWAQMIVQLAFARMLTAMGMPRAGGTYEAATTRRFLKGRTEAIRVVSSQSDEWVRSMDDPRIGRAERKRLFDAATKRHVALAVQSGQGQGVDRHLFGLKKVMKEGEPMPELFTDPLVSRSSYWVLSTSAIFSKHFPVYGWGEVVPDGFGVAYMTGYDHCLQYTITSRKEMPNARFCEEIAKAAVDLYELHSEGQAEKAKL